MNIQIIDIIAAQTFNERANHPMQSWQWGQARIETGIPVIRLGAYEESHLKDVFTMTIHPIPYTQYKIGYIPRSIIPPKELLDFLKDWGNKNNIIFIKFEPYVTKEQTIDNQRTTTNNLRLSPHPLFPSWTQVLDLTIPEDELLKQMKPKTRYNVGLAERKGVKIKEESNDEGFEKFIKLYFETTGRQRYFGHTKKYHRIIWDNLKSSIAHILIAYLNDEPLAGYELFLFKDRFYYPYGGSSESNRNIMAPNLIMWEAIKMGKKLGAKTFDMWGSLGPNYDPTDPWSGFTRFKEGYGTKFVEFAGSYDLVINSLLYNTYNLLHTVRSYYLKLKK